MSTIITRKGAEYWMGQSLPQNVALIISDHNGRRVVTWEDVHQERRERQKRTLECLRHVETWRACKLWVAYFDQPLMGGWQAFLENLRGRTWIDRDASDGMKAALMQLFPMSLWPDWYEWKKAFAKEFARRSQDGHPVGVAFLWRRGSELRRIG